MYSHKKKKKFHGENKSWENENHVRYSAYMIHHIFLSTVRTGLRKEAEKKKKSKKELDILF